MFFASFFHVVGYIFLWLRTSVEGKEASAHISAWIAFGGLCLVCILSLPYFRRVVYNVFFHSHWVGFIIYLVAVSVQPTAPSELVADYYHRSATTSLTLYTGPLEPSSSSDWTTLVNLTSLSLHLT